MIRLEASLETPSFSNLALRPSMSSGKWSDLVQIKRKIQKIFKVKKSLNPLKISKLLNNYSLKETWFFMIFKKEQIVIFLVLNNNFFYNEVVFGNIFIKTKHLIFFIRIFFTRIFPTRIIFFIRISLCLSFFKNISIRIASSEFFSSESEEISISSITYLGIFFSLTIYWHSSKNT